MEKKFPTFFFTQIEKRSVSQVVHCLLARHDNIIKKDSFFFLNSFFFFLFLCYKNSTGLKFFLAENTIEEQKRKFLRDLTWWAKIRWNLRNLIDGRSKNPESGQNKRGSKRKLNCFPKWEMKNILATIERPSKRKSMRREKKTNQKTRLKWKLNRPDLQQWW